jgi:ATP-dependent RNA helicase RhlB
MKKKSSSPAKSAHKQDDNSSTYTVIGAVFGLPVLREKKAPAPARKKSKPRPSRKKESRQAPPPFIDDPSWSVDDFNVPVEDGKKRFHDFAIPRQIMHGIAELKFSYCTPIQADVLDKTLAGQDALGRAQTGTGKSAAFLITILTRLLAEDRSAETGKASPGALIIAPTRELVMQIAEDGRLLGRYADLSIVAVYGGIDYQKQQDELETGHCDIVVATPGRLLDFQRRRIIDLSKVKIFVIDEADRMLDMGFIPDVRQIIYSLPGKARRQTLLFSATLTPEVNNLAAQWTKDPVLVEIEPEQVAVDSVEQIVYLVTAEQKYPLLYHVITSKKLERVIIFCNRKDETRKLTDMLKRCDINCSLLSGDVPQKQRIKTLENFKAGKIRVLVATDVAGRGIHIDDVSHVINFTLPYEAEDYVHRIGRTGRAGKSGISISFACEEGSFYLPDIEEYLGRKLPCTEPPEEWLTLPDNAMKKKKTSRNAPRKSPNRRRPKKS